MKTVAEADADNKITRYYIYGAGLIAMVTPADKVYCYHYNAIGSTIAITDQEQNLVNKYAYAPFGEILNQEEEIPQPFKFVGRYGVMSEPSGYYYMRARYYDPMQGRFISEDPLGFEGGDVNLYAYAGNNPMLVIDPLGLCGIDLTKETPISKLVKESLIAKGPGSLLGSAGRIYSKLLGMKGVGFGLGVAGESLSNRGPFEKLMSGAGSFLGFTVGSGVGALEGPLCSAVFGIGGAEIFGNQFGIYGKVSDEFWGTAPNELSNNQ